VVLKRQKYPQLNTTEFEKYTLFPKCLECPVKT
jgi:hypothetical protein